MAQAKKVLLIGLDPKVVDYAHLPTKLDEPTLRRGLAEDLEQLIARGYDAEWLLIDRGETAVQVATAKLAANRYDCILLGAGIRTVAPLLLLFEQLVNVVHERAPHAKIAFNTQPQDTPESVQRWV